MALEGLSSDLSYEILSRASLETLARCRAVCREWNNVTYEPSFVDVYADRSQTISGYYIEGYDRDYCTDFVSTGGETPEMSLGFMPQGRYLRVKATDQGIVLCLKEWSEGRPNRQDYFVCKPSTKEWVKIPYPKTKYKTFVTAIHVFRARPHYVHFKILRVSEYPFCSVNGLCCEIFDSKAWRWKRLADIKSQSNHYFGNADAVVVGGKANWLDDNKMFEFDMYNETCSVFPLCIESDREMADLWRARLVNQKGKLGLLLPTQELDNVYLFVVDGKDPITGSPVWKKRNCYSVKGMEEANWSPFEVMSLHSMNGALVRDLNSNIAICRCQPPVIQDKRRCRGIPRAFPFRSDFNPCNLTDFVKSASSKTSKVKKIKKSMMNGNVSRSVFSPNPRHGLLDFLVALIVILSVVGYVLFSS